MEPGPDEQPLAVPGVRHALGHDAVEVPHLRVRIPVVPARVVHDRGVDLVPLLVDRVLPPVVVVVRVLDHVGHHAGEHAPAHRRLGFEPLLVPLQPGLVGADVAGPPPGVVERHRLDHLVLREQPGRHDHVERAARPVEVLVGVRRRVRAEHGGQVRRPGRRGQVLVEAGEREPLRPHLPGGPGLGARPLDGVVAVLVLVPRLVEQPVVDALRVVAAALVLDDRDVAALGEIGREPVRAVALVVGRPLEDHRPRTVALVVGHVHVGGELGAVAHRHHHLLAGVGLGRGGAGSQQEERCAQQGPGRTTT